MCKNERNSEKDSKSKFVRKMCTICFGQGLIDVGFSDYKDCPAKCENGFHLVNNVNYTESQNENLSNT